MPAATRIATVLTVLFLPLHVLMAGDLIEFSAVLHDFSGEGVVYKRLLFKDNNRTIFYQPPKGWRCMTVDNQLRLIPPATTFAEGRIESRALEKPVPIDEKTAKKLTQQVITGTRPGSQQIVIVKQEQNS